MFLVIYDDEKKEIVIKDKDHKNQWVLLKFTCHNLKQTQEHYVEITATAKEVDAQINAYAQRHPYMGNTYVQAQERWGENRKKRKEIREKTAKKNKELLGKLRSSRQTSSP